MSISIRRSLTVSLAALALAACDDDPSSPGPEQFRATLNGANERPDPVQGVGTGTATLSSNGTAVTFSIRLVNMTGVTAAHIHFGDANTVSGVLVPLFSQASPGANVSDGELTSGSFTADDIKPLPNQTTKISMDSLHKLMRTSNAYVNVHTTAYPAGAVRGQVAPAP